MRSLLRVGVFAGAVTAAWGFTACGFHVNGATTDGGGGGGGGGGGSDGGIDSGSSGIDAGSDAGVTALCTMGTQYCSGSALFACDPDTGSSTMTSACDPWGCSSSGGAHCADIVPTGGSAGDLDGSGLGSQTFADGTTINTATGEIDAMNGSMIRAPGSGIISEIDYYQRSDGAAVFRFAGLTIGKLSFSPPAAGQTMVPAVVLISTADIAANGAIDAQGTCMNGIGGPGGFPGGSAAANGSGSGGGGGSSGGVATGGGGGGYGTAGAAGGTGSGATPAAGGSMFGTDAISPLVGGGGGGGGAGATTGGGGGGAIQLVAHGQIQLGGSINAGGCGGPGGTTIPADSGGGGGAGGSILLEANTIMIAGGAKLAANGGGGGANATTNGANGGLNRTPAGGGNGFADGGPGGAGSTAPAAGSSVLWDAGGGHDNLYHSGGGGGAIGRIRFNTGSGSVSIPNEDNLSPNMTDATTCTAGSAAVQ